MKGLPDLAVYLHRWDEESRDCPAFGANFNKSIRSSTGNELKGKVLPSVSCFILVCKLVLVSLNSQVQ